MCTKCVGAIRRRQSYGGQGRKETKLADRKMGDWRWAGGAGEKSFTVFAGEKLSALTRLDYACQNRAEFYRT